MRNEALERAIIDRPDDLALRAVYGDWLDAHGDPRGAWCALSTAAETEPTFERRRAALAYFAANTAAVVGNAGAALVASGAWLGWRGGFVDEIRLPIADARLGELLAHPAARFVRRIGIGGHGAPAEAEAVAALASAAPPLLDTVVVFDSFPGGPTVALDAIVALPTLRRLGVRGGWWRTEAPQIAELHVALDSRAPSLATLLATLPGLETLTIDITRWPMPRRAIDAATARCPRIATRTVLGDDGDDPNAWLERAIATGGREAVALVPGAGELLYSLGRRISYEDEPRALPLLEAACTLPAMGVDVHAQEAAAAGRARQGALEDAELLARAGLLAGPRNHRLLAVALRASCARGRVDDAGALVPAVEEALDDDVLRSLRPESWRACLHAAMAALVFADRARDALALAAHHAKSLDANHCAVVAIAHAALGELDEARGALARAVDPGEPVRDASARAVFDHAVAAVALAETPPRVAVARDALARAKAAAYVDWWWAERLYQRVA